ncbi:MAG: hypothetical protein KF773_32450 [Deltaproteobacteria bacterium]|nr:hypothetical protein [Deltaproteobacteria bacterium]
MHQRLLTLDSNDAADSGPAVVIIPCNVKRETQLRSEWSIPFTSGRNLVSLRIQDPGDNVDVGGIVEIVGPESAGAIESFPLMPLAAAIVVAYVALVHLIDRRPHPGCRAQRGRGADRR